MGAVLSRAPADPEEVRAQAWFRLDPLLDGDGALRAQRLVVGLAGSPARLSSELPAESFAAGPFGRIVLVGTDDGSSSRLDAWDVDRSCAYPLAIEGDVIRRATIDHSTGTVVETRVRRFDRTDLGVWRRPLDATGPAHRILEPLPVDNRFGRTFSTELSWDVAGVGLAVETCGERACRTRFVEAGDAATATIADPDLGVLIGFDRDHVVAYEACRGLPCAIVSIDRTDGRRVVVDALGGRAVVVAGEDGPRLLRVVQEGPGRRLRSTALDGSEAADSGPVPDGLDVLSPVLDQGAGTRLPAGWLVLAADGRLTAPPSGVRPELRRVADGTSVPIDEVLR
jgi:hypothetical protein